MPKYFVWILMPIICITSCNKKNEVIVKPAVVNQMNLKATPQEVELFSEGFISTGLYERDIAISPNNDEIVFTLGNYNQTLRSLVVTKKTEDGWGDKEILNISGTYNDIEPFFSPDGKKLYFASTRPIDSISKSADYNIWVSEKDGDHWAEPIPLPAIINTSSDEFYPSVSENGNLYFTATRPNSIGGEDIFVSRYVDGNHQEPQPLDMNINSEFMEFNAYINPSEDLIIFGSYKRQDGLGGGDLYYSKKDSLGNWTQSINLGSEINSEKLDFCPFVDYPNRNFYFTSSRSEIFNKRIDSVAQLIYEANKPMNGMGNIYRIGLDQLNLE